MGNNGANSNSQPLICVIYDTEFTAWEGSNKRNWKGEGEHRELIQLAALKIAVGPWGVDILERFNSLIKPYINPQLSDYITDLTGITQAHIDNYGVDLGSVLHSFYQFCNDNELLVFAWGNDKSVIEENCRLNALPLPLRFEHFKNLKPLAVEHSLIGRTVSSGQLAAEVGVSIEGHPHNALFDVENIAAALNYWLINDQLEVSQLSELV